MTGIIQNLVRKGSSEELHKNDLSVIPGKPEPLKDTALPVENDISSNGSDTGSAMD